jgi:hypothetical protein
MPIPDDAEHAKTIIDNSLQQSVTAVHLLGAWYGDFVKNSKYSLLTFRSRR